MTDDTSKAPDPSIPANDTLHDIIRGVVQDEFSAAKLLDPQHLPDLRFWLPSFVQFNRIQHGHSHRNDGDDPIPFPTGGAPTWLDTIQSASAAMGTYTVPVTDPQALIIEIAGGGGGSGATCTVSATSGSAGGGGGGGGYSRMLVFTPNIATSYSYTCGDGGTGGSSAASAASAGGQGGTGAHTYFSDGAFVFGHATPGQGGFGSDKAEKVGAGGIQGNGQSLVLDSLGNPALWFDVQGGLGGQPALGIGGMGGDSFFGGVASGGVTAALTTSGTGTRPANGSPFGGGAGGAAGVANGGLSGGRGLIVVTIYGGALT